MVAEIHKRGYVTCGRHAGDVGLVLSVYPPLRKGDWPIAGTLRDGPIDSYMKTSGDAAEAAERMIKHAVFGKRTDMSYETQRQVSEIVDVMRVETSEMLRQQAGEIVKLRGQLERQGTIPAQPRELPPVPAAPPPDLIMAMPPAMGEEEPERVAPHVPSPPPQKNRRIVDPVEWLRRAKELGMDRGAGQTHEQWNEKVRLAWYARKNKKQVAPA